MKEVSPEKYTNMQVSGNLTSWAKDMKAFLFWHDRSIMELIECFHSNWAMDQKWRAKKSRSAAQTGS